LADEGGPEVGDHDAIAILQQAGLDPTTGGGGEDDTDGEDGGSGSGGTRGRRRGRQPVPA
jgi:hypothetical protein